MGNSSQFFRVRTMSWSAIAWLIAGAAVPILIVMTAMWAVQEQSRFTSWFAVGVALIASLAIFLQLISVSVYVNPALMIVGGGLYLTEVDRRSILRGEIRILTASDAARRLHWRTNGIGVPGFALGWYRSSGGRKVFALVTDQSPVLVPTRLGYDLLISPVDKEHFILVLQSVV